MQRTHRAPPRANVDTGSLPPRDFSADVRREMETMQASLNGQLDSALAAAAPNFNDYENDGAVLARDASNRTFGSDEGNSAIAIREYNDDGAGDGDMFPQIGSVNKLNTTSPARLQDFNYNRDSSGSPARRIGGGIADLNESSTDHQDRTNSKAAKQAAYAQQLQQQIADKSLNNNNNKSYNNKSPERGRRAGGQPQTPPSNNRLGAPQRGRNLPANHHHSLGSNISFGDDSSPMRDSFLHADADMKANNKSINNNMLPPALSVRGVPNPFGSPSPQKPESYSRDVSPEHGSPGARARLVSDVYGTSHDITAFDPHQDKGKDLSAAWRPGGRQMNSREKQIVITTKATLEAQIAEVRERKAKEKREDLEKEAADERRVRAELQEIGLLNQEEKAKKKALALEGMEEMKQKQNTQINEALRRKGRLGSKVASEGLSPTHRDPTHLKNGRRVPLANPQKPIEADKGDSHDMGKQQHGKKVRIGANPTGFPNMPPTEEEEATRWATRPRTADMGPALASVSQFTEAALAPMGSSFLLENGMGMNRIPSAEQFDAYLVNWQRELKTPHAQRGGINRLNMPPEALLMNIPSLDTSGRSKGNQGQGQANQHVMNNSMTHKVERELPLVSKSVAVPTNPFDAAASLGTNKTGGKGTGQEPSVLGHGGAAALGGTIMNGLEKAGTGNVLIRTLAEEKKRNAEYMAHIGSNSSFLETVLPQAAKTAYLQSRVPLHTKLPTDDPQFFSKQLQAGLARVKGIGSKEKAEHALEQRMKIYDPKVDLWDQPAVPLWKSPGKQAMRKLMQQEQIFVPPTADERAVLQQERAMRASQMEGGVTYQTQGQTQGQGQVSISPVSSPVRARVTHEDAYAASAYSDDLQQQNDKYQVAIAEQRHKTQRLDAKLKAKQQAEKALKKGKRKGGSPSSTKATGSKAHLHKSPLSEQEKRRVKQEMDRQVEQYAALMIPTEDGKEILKPAAARGIGTHSPAIANSAQPQEDEEEEDEDEEEMMYVAQTTPAITAQLQEAYLEEERQQARVASGRSSPYIEGPNSGPGSPNLSNSPSTVQTRQSPQTVLEQADDEEEGVYEDEVDMSAEQTDSSPLDGPYPEEEQGQEQVVPVAATEEEDEGEETGMYEDEEESQSQSQPAATEGSAQGQFLDPLSMGLQVDEEGFTIPDPDPEGAADGIMTITNVLAFGTQDSDWFSARQDPLVSMRFANWTAQAGAMPKTGGEGDAWNFCSSPGNALESPVFLEHLERHCFEMQVFDEDVYIGMARVSLLPCIEEDLIESDVKLEGQLLNEAGDVVGRVEAYVRINLSEEYDEEDEEEEISAGMVQQSSSQSQEQVAVGGVDNLESQMQHDDSLLSVAVGGGDGYGDDGDDDGIYEDEEPSLSLDQGHNIMGQNQDQDAEAETYGEEDEDEQRVVPMSAIQDNISSTGGSLSRGVPQVGLNDHMGQNRGQGDINTPDDEYGDDSYDDEGLSGEASQGLNNQNQGKNQDQQQQVSQTQVNTNEGHEQDQNQYEEEDEDDGEDGDDDGYYENEGFSGESSTAQIQAQTPVVAVDQVQQGQQIIAQSQPAPAPLDEMEGDASEIDDDEEEEEEEEGDEDVEQDVDVNISSAIGSMPHNQTSGVADRDEVEEDMIEEEGGPEGAVGANAGFYGNEEEVEDEEEEEEQENAVNNGTGAAMLGEGEYGIEDDGSEVYSDNFTSGGPTGSNSLSDLLERQGHLTVPEGELDVPDEVDDEDEDDEDDDDKPKFVGVVTFKLVCGRDIAPKSTLFEGKCDPYVVLSMGPQSVQSKRVDNTTNPTYDERMLLSWDGFSVLHVQVNDYNEEPVEHEFLGEAYIELENLNLQSDQTISHEVALENADSGTLSFEITLRSGNEGATQVPGFN